MMSWLKREARVISISGVAVALLALGTLSFADVTSSGFTWFSNTCFTTKQCGATTLIDSAGTEKGTNANPLTVGDANQVPTDPTVTASTYSLGQCVGGFQAVTVTNNNGESGVITNFRIVSASGVTGTIGVYLFRESPTSSTCTEHGTFTLNAADIDKLIGTPGSGVVFAAPIGTTATVASVDYSPPRPFIAGGVHTSGVKTIYYAMVAGSALSAPGSTSDIHTNIGAVLN